MLPEEIGIQQEQEQEQEVHVLNPIEEEESKQEEEEEESSNKPGPAAMGFDESDIIQSDLSSGQTESVGNLRYAFIS